MLRGRLAVLRVLMLAPLLSLGAQAHAGGWFYCGNLTQIGWSCQLASYPSASYEYGISYNSAEPHVINCSYWNYGMRIYNRVPYFVQSDNPAASSRWGGFVFYTGTLASDDDTCNYGTWRHRYWELNINNHVVLSWGNNCHGSETAIYCRAR